MKSLKADFAKDAVKLMCLRPAYTLAVIPRGKSFFIETEGVLLTIDQEKPLALVEQSSGQAEIKVGDERMHDVGVIKTGQPFSINRVPFVLLDDKRVFVQGEEGDIRLDETHAASLKAKLRVMSPSDRSDRASLVAKASFLIMIFLGLTLQLSLFMGDQRAAESIAAAPDPFAVKTAIPAAKLLPDLTSDELVKMPMTAPLAEKKPSKSASDQPKHEVVPGKRGPNPAPLRRADAAQLREQEQVFQEYLLEARFDPDSARRKIRSLAGEVARGSELSKRMYAYLNTHP